jgi:hypothetical protein
MALPNGLTPPKVERVAHIVDLMAAGEWVTGKTGVLLAREWRLEAATVRQDAAEASRQLRALVTPADREERRMVWLLSLEATRRKAMEAGRFEAAIRSLELEGKALGFFEPEAVEEMSTEELLGRIGAIVAGLPESERRDFVQKWAFDVVAGEPDGTP